MAALEMTLAGLFVRSERLTYRQIRLQSFLRKNPANLSGKPHLTAVVVKMLFFYPASTPFVVNW